MTEQQFLEKFDSKDRDFEMFTEAGNKVCQRITRELINFIFSKQRRSVEEVMEKAGGLIAKQVNTGKHREILDTEPPIHIAHYTRKAWEIAGYGAEFDKYDILSKVWDKLEKK